MRGWTAAFLALLVVSCSPGRQATKSDLTGFAEQTRACQTLYMGGGDNCPELLATMDHSIRFSDNGEEWSRAQLEQFCPHLPEKDVTETIHRHRLLAPRPGRRTGRRATGAGT